MAVAIFSRDVLVIPRFEEVGAFFVHYRNYHNVLLLTRACVCVSMHILWLRSRPSPLTIQNTCSPT